MNHPRHNVRLEGITRRQFLEAASACTAALAVGQWGTAAETVASGQSSLVEPISDHLLVYHGPVNVGIIRDGGRALVIDCGDGSFAKAAQLEIHQVEQLLFTHHHRDQACGAERLIAAGAKVAVPVAEREHFANPASYWNDDRNLWRVYQSFRPHPLTLVEPITVDRTLDDGDEIVFGNAKIRVIPTPGHTDGSISFLVEIDGRRVVFGGDLISGEGRIWDVYSLQRGFSKNGQTIGGYHGFMGDRPRLVESLNRIKSLDAEMIIPSHGETVKQPAAAIGTLVERLDACYENYVGISALRHYFPKLFTDYENRPGQMPIRAGTEPPGCLRHFGTTWMLVSETGGALVMDAGSPAIVDRLKAMLSSGEIKAIEGLWVTHYHFDHTDGIPKFQQEFDCPCFAQQRLAEVLVRPAGWRLPCLAPEAIRVDRPLEDGYSWQWHEYKLTAFDYPGQTLYHDALLVESEGLRMLFVGDSHTPSGIDDYCAQNRNFLGREVGFQYCLSLIEKLKPTHIFNCHVDVAFTFTSEEIEFMRQNLDRRERLFGELVAWDHANYALDASWVRCDPYVQKTSPGKPPGVEVVVTNHSAEPRRVRMRAAVPAALGGKPSEWAEINVPAKSEGRTAIRLPAVPESATGRHVVPIDVHYGERMLPQFAEAIIDVGSLSNLSG